MDVQSSMLSLWERLESSKLAKERKAVPLWYISLFLRYLMVLPNIIPSYIQTTPTPHTLPQGTYPPFDNLVIDKLLYYYCSFQKRLES